MPKRKTKLTCELCENKDAKLCETKFFSSQGWEVQEWTLCNSCMAKNDARVKEVKKENLEHAA